jgi:hypothetical protein
MFYLLILGEKKKKEKGETARRFFPRDDISN